MTRVQETVPAGRATLLILAFAVLGATGGLLAAHWFAAPDAARPSAQGGTPTAVIGDLLPDDLALADLAGTSRPLASWRGRPLLLNFWATWCAPCVEEMPILDAFARQEGPNGVQVVGIALDDADAVRDFLQRLPVAYPILLGGTPGPRDLSVRLGNRHSVLPFSVLVGGDGRVRATEFGEFSADELAEWVDNHR